MKVLHTWKTKQKHVALNRCGSAGTFGESEKCDHKLINWIEYESECAVSATRDVMRRVHADHWGGKDVIEFVIFNYLFIFSERFFYVVVRINGYRPLWTKKNHKFVQINAQTHHRRT